MTGRCTLVCCAFDRERANHAPGRRSLTPLYTPVTATRDAVAGGSTSSALNAESAPEPRTDRLGSRSALDASPAKGERPAGHPVKRGVRQGLADAAPTQLPSSALPSVRMRWVDDLFDDLAFAAGWGVLALLGLMVAFVVAVRVFGGAA